MSCPEWWGAVQRALRGHPQRKQQIAAMRTVLQAAQITGMPKAHSASRTTENAALRGLSGWDELAYSSVEAAITETKGYTDGALRLRLIELKYWRRPYSTLKEAALVLYISEPTAWRYHGDFIRTVAKYMGFM